MGKQTAIVAVLAGGRAERLGGAKATAVLGGRPLACHPLAAARTAGLEAIVVAKASTPLPVLAERIVREPETPTHPLCGVLAALDFASLRSPAPDVVLLACDMPFLAPQLLSWLATLDGPAMVEAGGRAQPLLSRCRVRDRPVLLEALHDGCSLTGAMRRLDLELLDDRLLSRFGEPWRLCFNVNDAEDLRVAEELLA
jgi:molybdopterin-guanine dinucleotide biosynthesis protein A